MRVYQVAALLGAAGLLATAVAGADETGKARAEVQEQRKELKDKLKENAKELKDKEKELKDKDIEGKRELGEKKQELAKEANEERKELNQALAKLRETRLERRKEMRDSLRTKYGEVLKSSAVREELKTHAWRVARLNQIKRIADDQDNGKVEARADKLLERENTRHEKRMEALKTEPGTDTAAVNQKGGVNPGTNPAGNNVPAGNTPAAANPGLEKPAAAKNPGAGSDKGGTP